MFLRIQSFSTSVPESGHSPFSLQTHLRDGVGGTGVGEGGGRRAVGGDGSHNLGGVSDILPGGGASGDGENSGSGELHFDGRVRVLKLRDSEE